MNTYQLEQFAALVDLMTDPKKIKAMVDEARAATAALQDEREKQRQIRDVDLYRSEVLETLTKRAEALDAKAADLNKRMDEFASARDAANADLKDRELKFQARYKALDDMAKQAEHIQADMQSLATAQEDLVKSREELAFRLQAVKKREDQLAAVLKGTE